MPAWNRTILASVAAFTMFAAPGGADAFWASHGSYGSLGSRGSYGSYGSSASYGSRGSYASSGSYASTGSHGSSGGSYASSSSHGSSSSYGSYGPGPLKRLIMHKRAMRASHGSSGGSSSSYGSHGSSAGSSGGSSGGTVVYHYRASSSHGSSASHGSSGGSSASYGSYSRYSSVTTSSAHIVAAKPVAPAVPTLASAATVQTGSATLRVDVPANAKVFVNDRATTSTGSQRQFVSNGLEIGKSYTYRVRVEFQREGQTVVESKVVRLTAGADEALAFRMEPTPAAIVAEEESTQPAVEAADSAFTKLTLNVPADAKVTLAGAKTQQTGVVREFLTSKLASGTTWENYTVRVESTIDGKPVVQERVITLRGGEAQSLVFNFASTQLASLE